jgi:serine phosphatase RsbU (regulator of sigma subunit)
MSLRTRLIVAFFLLSVVPLAALTYYTHRSNAAAVRDAAEREADVLAAELGQRMQLVTAQLSQRVEFLMDISALEAELERAAEDRTPVTVTASSRPEETDVLGTTVAKALGDAAVWLSNVELQDMRFQGGRGRGPRPPGPPGTGGATGRVGPPPPANAQGTASVSRSTSAQRGQGQGRSTSARRPPDSPPNTGRGTPPTATPQVGQVPAMTQVAPPPVPPPAPVSGTAPPAPSTATPSGAPAAPAPANLPGKLTIDLGPIQREIFRQILPEGRTENLSRDEWQRVMREVNQRMLGIQKGIQLGAEAIKQQADAVAREQAAKAKAAARTPAAASAAAPREGVVTATKRSSSISGNKLDVKVERDGQVVRQANAEINLPAVLQTVFATTHRDRGEVPFAVDKAGRIYTPTEEDRRTVAAFGEVSTPTGPALSRQDNWIIVTTNDPTGSGLKMGIARPVGDTLADLRRATARNAAIGLGFIGLALVGIVPLSGRLTRNLSTLSDGVRRIAKGDYRARVPVKGRDEVSALAAAFNQMAADVERHQRSAVEQERLKRELELGRQIQHDMLPHAPLRLGLTEIKGVSVPAREVGGDFFNYFETPSGQLAMLVGDVSGKGVGAALLMANIQASLRTRLALGQDLSALAEELDRDIETGSPAPVYATLFVGLFDPTTRVLRYVNAGHNPQYVLRREGGLTQMSSTGMPVGLFAGHGYQEQREQLSPGDLLFFYTDGCVEAENEAGEMFGTDRLEAILKATTSPDDVMARVEAEVVVFRGTRELFDDATMMAVRVG